MKKKSLFRKATALICCIAMCITTFMPAIYAVDGSPTVTMSIPDGVSLMSDDLNEIDATGSSTGYAYNVVDNKVTFSANEGETLLKSTILFYASSDLKPTVSSDNTLRCRVTIGDSFEENGRNYWEIRVQFLGTNAGNYNITYTEGVQKYNVTFTSDSSLNFVGTDGKTMANGEYEKGDISFNVNARPGVDTTGKRIDVYADSTLLEITDDGVYTYNVHGDVDFYAALTAITHEVTPPEVSERYTYVSTSSTTVAEGGSFTFFVTPVDGYETPDVSIQPKEVATLNNVGNNQYVISNIKGDVRINVVAGNSVQHGVVYPMDVGYEITNNSNTVTDNTDLTFTVTPDDAYDIKGVTATVGGRVAEVTDNKNGTYTISNVKGDVVISVNAQKKMLNVTFDTDAMTGKATTTANDVTVEYGTQYSFYVTPVEGHGNASVYLIKNGTQELISPVTVNGTQYVVNVTENTDIKIVGADFNEYTVTLNGGTGFTYENAGSSVMHNNTYTFEVHVNPEYNKSKPVVSVNNVIIAATNNGANGIWEYEIENVTENKIVSVSGLQINTYKVTLQGGAGYSFSTTDSTTVSHNDSFAFRLNIDAGYKKGNDFRVSVTGGTLNETDAANGNYVISNITDDITVNVTGVETATSKIVKIDEGNATVTNVAVNDEITYNGYISFSVTPEKGYRIENVFVNGESKNALNGTYRVNNITSDVEIVVVTVANKLTVNYVSTEDHIFNETKEYTVETIQNVLNTQPGLNDCIVHSFKGWNYNGGVADAESLGNLISNNDYTVTLVAEFSINSDEAIANELLKLANTTKEQLEISDNSYRTTFRTVIDIIAGIDLVNQPCVAKYVKVTAHGTLLANTANAGFAGMSEDLKDRKNTVSGTTVGEQLEGGKVFNYYTNCNYTWSEFSAVCQNPNNAQIVLRITSSYAENSLNAAGWVELTVGDANIYIISGESGQLVTSAE